MAPSILTSEGDADMPLERDTLTIASRVMLPAYLVTNALFAAVFLIDPQDRLGRAPSLEYVRGWMPIERWGLMWFTLAALMLMAIVVQHRLTFIVTLAVNVGTWVTWGYFVERAVLTSPDVTMLAGALPLFVATASFASMLSLLVGER